MTINQIKALLKSNGVEKTAEDIRQKLAELRLKEGSLTEESVSLVVNSFLQSQITTQTTSNKLANEKLANNKQKIKSEVNQKIKADINAFKQPLDEFAERYSSDEAFNIYEQTIASVPDKVIQKTIELITNHQGDPKSCSDIGQQLASALFADFYTN